MCKGQLPTWALNYITLRLRKKEEEEVGRRMSERRQLREGYIHLWFYVMRSTLWKQNGWSTEHMHTVSRDVKTSRWFTFIASCSSPKPLINAEQLHASGGAWLYHLKCSMCLWAGYSSVALEALCVTSPSVLLCSLSSSTQTQEIIYHLFQPAVERD